MVPVDGDLRAGAGDRDLDRRGFPGGGAAVPGGVSSDWLWVRVPAQIGRRFI